MNEERERQEEEALLARYRRESAEEAGAPAAATRAAILAEARAAALRRTPAANDSHWKLRMVAALAIVGLGAVWWRLAERPRLSPETTAITPQTEAAAPIEKSVASSAAVDAPPPPKVDIQLAPMPPPAALPAEGPAPTVPPPAQATPSTPSSQESAAGGRGEVRSRNEPLVRDETVARDEAVTREVAVAREEAVARGKVVAEDKTVREASVAAPALAGAATSAASPSAAAPSAAAPSAAAPSSARANADVEAVVVTGVRAAARKPDRRAFAAPSTLLQERFPDVWQGDKPARLWIVQDASGAVLASGELTGEARVQDVYEEFLREHGGWRLQDQQQSVIRNARGAELLLYTARAVASR